MAKNSGDSTIKFLIYVLLFLIFVLLMLVLFIIPSIKNYKANKSDFKTYTSQNEHLSLKQVELSQKIERYKQENVKLIEAFSHPFDEAEFLTFAHHYFTDTSVLKGENQSMNSQFVEYTFKATSQTKTPVDFYRFIDDLEKYSSIIKINFPITLVSKGKNIELDFNMSIYKAN